MSLMTRGAARRVVAIAAAGAMLTAAAPSAWADAGPDDPVDATITVPKVSGLSDDFAMGVDISTILSEEESGVTYRDYDGTTADIFDVLAESGVNYVRIRIWNDPYDADGHGYGAGDVDVVVAVEVRMDPTLQADLGGADGHRLQYPLLDVVQGQQVRRAPQVQGERALGEAAEAALEGAHVGVVDVPVAHEGDDIAHDGAAQIVGHLADGDHLGASRAEQRDDLVDTDLMAHEHTGEHLAHRAAGPTSRRHERWRCRVCPGVPLRAP